MPGLASFVVIVLVVVASIVLGLLVYCSFHALYRKARHSPRTRNLKFWVRPSPNGMQPGSSSEQIFGPLVEDPGASPILQRVHRVGSSDSRNTAETEAGTVEVNEEACLQKAEMKISILRDSGESWDEAKVKVSDGSNALSPELCLIDVSVHEDSRGSDSELFVCNTGAMS